ncbi:acyltransferase family protein [Desulfosporosinus sp. PR]|uniref:acyltransferase family protein n=1 Tax=Candidatus Desulfosporosinus nitrosoreducens TaxID=3401928 RepID=UPI0027F15290|nr:acyltransferase family protein [Desulfosporosinus sp. PR]MDQ7095583.1 acyltransferase family protein [Desulfosporosinus sp. PR]
MGTAFAQETEHLEWADILKGLGILTVVWGHAGSKISFYMFWFHMPLFFWISGYLYRFKPGERGSSYLLRKAKHLLIPYVFYLGFLTLIALAFALWKGQAAAQFWEQNWQALLLGGSLLAGVYATFWFPTCLFAVQIVYDVLCRRVSSPVLKGLLVLGCFLLAYWESRYHAGIFVPWNLDVGLYAIVFYALGQAMRQNKLLAGARGRTLVFGISWLIAIGFVYLYAQHILDYGLDMKHRQYYYFGLNLLLPAAFTLIIVQLSMLLTKIPAVNRGLIGLGKAAMVIMYLHLGFVDAAGHFLAVTPLRFFALGTVGPLLFYKLIRRVPYGPYLALGELPKSVGLSGPRSHSYPTRSL